jgi:cellulose biosynthesis protein BcsQ
MKSVAFFNNKGGVGKTSLVYHLTWMLSDMGLKVLAADFDPQANLTSMFVEDDELEIFWPDGNHPQTIYGALQPILEGTGDVRTPHVKEVGDNLGLIVGDLKLSAAEDELNSQWPDCLDRKPRAFRVISALYRAALSAASAQEADLVLIDVGPNLGAVNRAALIAADFVAIPITPDIYSLQGLRNLGPTLHGWRKGWEERRLRCPLGDLMLPAGGMLPVGYIVMQHAVRLDRPVKAYERWMARIPGTYREAVLGEEAKAGIEIHKDPHCVATLKHYRSLMPLAQEARKPMFNLKPADGALGSHVQAAQSCHRDFRKLAGEIARRCGVALP